MINSTNSTMFSQSLSRAFLLGHIVCLGDFTDGTRNCLSSGEKVVLPTFTEMKHEALGVIFSCEQLHTHRCWLRLPISVFSNFRSQIPSPRAVVRTAFPCLFVTDGCAQRRNHCCKRCGHPDCINQSQCGVEMCFYPATDLQGPPLLSWTQVG